MSDNGYMFTEDAISNIVSRIISNLIENRMIQPNKVDKLEAKVSELEAKISELEAKVN